MLAISPPPDLSAEDHATAPFVLRYEDLCQDGRVQLRAIFQASGPAVWERLIDGNAALRALRQQGTIPVLSRLVIEGTPEPFSIDGVFSVAGCYRLAHAKSGDTVERILALMWGHLSGTRGRDFGPSPTGAGALALCGRFFAENVFTRPFAPPGDRKVVRFEIPGIAAVPEHAYAPQPHESILALPEGAIPLEPALSPDHGPLAFGLRHTDSNQHVNSLVYPGLFEEAALRRFAVLGESTALLARSAEVGYRKPCFAGDRVRILLQAFALGERRGAVGVFVADAGARTDGSSPTAPRPSCYVRMLFDR